MFLIYIFFVLISEQLMENVPLGLDQEDCSMLQQQEQQQQQQHIAYVHSENAPTITADGNIFQQTNINHPQQQQIILQQQQQQHQENDISCMLSPTSSLSPTTANSHNHHHPHHHHQSYGLVTTAVPPTAVAADVAATPLSFLTMTKTFATDISN